LHLQYVILLANPCAGLWKRGRAPRTVGEDHEPKGDDHDERPWSSRTRRHGGTARFCPDRLGGDRPGTFAIARDGQLTVFSSVLVEPRKAEMMGGWTSGALDCNRRRLLEVRIAIDRVRSGNTTRLRDQRSGLVRNCAEGGPNFGVSPTASQAGMACPDGTWRPGRYTFVANTLFRAHGLRAIASLSFRETDPC
jgi:hypothetical protein